MKDLKQDLRFPFIYAADLVRSMATVKHEELPIQVPVLSRSQASAIWGALAEIWGLDKHECAQKLGHVYVEQHLEDFE